jgi:amino acid adenylation domain-containing protein
MIPASYAQQRLWFSEQAADAPGLYNLPFALRLQGELDRGALRSAITDVVERHEALRTVFLETDAGLAQRIVELANQPIEFIEESSTELESALAELAGRPFDLAADLPIRAHLFRIEPTEHVLLLVMHHIATDGWSLRPLLTDLAAAYRARAAGEAPDFEPLPVQYADYTLWQRELLGDPADPDSMATRQQDFWLRTLADLPEQCSLPTDRPRPQSPSHRGAAVSRSAGVELQRGLAELARAHQATLFMVVQAGLSALMSRLGAGTDIVLGTAVSGRTDEALDELVGFFVNTLVLRTDLSGDPTVTELIGQVRDRDLDIFANQDIPFERIVELVRPTRTLSRHPLFQVMLVVQNQARATAEPAEGLSMAPREAGTDAVKLDLSLAAIEDEGGLKFNADFAHDLFDAESVGTVLDRLISVLGQMVSDPAGRISALSVISAQERSQLLEVFVTNGIEPVADEPILAALRRHDPATVAILDSRGELTYRELTEQSDRLAGQLIGLGVRPGQVIGLHLPRCRELIVAELAVFKAGAAYLPLDPNYPTDRLEQICADCQAPVVLSLASLAGRFDPAGATVLELDRLPELLYVDSKIPIGPRDAAYVIYTSGSTGRPKGVVIEHASLARFCDLHADDLDLDRHARTGLIVNPGFDASVADIWPVLVRGGSVAIPDPTDLEDDELFARWLATAGVTAASVPTVRVSEVLPHLLRAPGRLRAVYAGGDRLVRVTDQPLPFRFVNYYGPTENTVTSTGTDVRFDQLGETELPTIGRPVTGVRCYVLDDFLQPVPAGVPGELWLGGSQHGRGYLNRPALTASRYVADPFVGGARMYRTGDQVMWRADGQLEFIGRVDGQIKLRGLRIEIGEIEAVLTAHPAVLQAAVVVHERAPGNKALHGFVQLTDGTGGDELLAAIKAFAAATLPDYMVPAGLQVLDAFPATTNGKLDRARLVPTVNVARTEHRAPRTELETTLCDIFAALLDQESVGIDDNFFDLGGHSLLATRAIGRVRQQFDLQLTVRDIFEAPTVLGLAERVQAALAEQGPRRVPLRPRLASNEPVLASFAQQRLWFSEQAADVPGLYNMPFALDLRGELDRDALRSALTDVVERHHALRTVFAERDGVLTQRVIELTGPLPLDLHAELTPGLLLTLAGTPFDLSTELPIRAHLIDNGAAEHVLLLVLHHIAGDGWSLGPLTADLRTAYAARILGEAPEFAPLPVQYADYSLWQHELLGSIADEESLLSRQVAYWATALAGAPEQCSLPADRSRPQQPSHRGSAVSRRLDADRHRALAGLARTHSATLFMVLQAGLAVLMSRLGAGEDIVLGTSLSGRTEEPLADVVGFFVNTMALRTDLSGNPTGTELLARVRNHDLDAFAHQDIPFERVVEAVNPTRTLARHPLFQVMLSVQNLPAASAGTESTLSITPRSAGTESVKFDLSLAAVEAPDLAGIELTADFAHDLYDPATVAGLLDRLVAVLDQLAARPDEPIGALTITTAAERAELLTDYAMSGLAVGSTEPILSLLRERMIEQPDAPAIRDTAGVLSYRELDEWADRLTGRLQVLGVRPGQVVGVHLPRGRELVVAELAVLRAGAAYLPLDPGYPAERLSQICADCQAPVVLSLTTLAGRFDPAGAVVLHLDEADSPDTAIQSAPARVERADAAYVIYTSGSTGKPKGVVIEHHSLARMCHATIDGLALTGPDRASMIANPGFDGSVQEIWPILLIGGTLLIPPPRVFEDELLMADWIVESGTTVCYLPTVRMTGLLPELSGRPSALRLIYAGGDRLTRVVDQPLPFRVVNVYGPTEATCFVTWTDVEFDRLTGPELPSIGRPLPGVRCYVLDDRLQPVPVGVPGELWLAGAHTGRGYLNRAELTASRYIADPFADGERMYRTGDLVSWRPDGALDFIGRKDGQIKLRGLRIEIGEIEAVLGSHPAVSRAVVTVHERTPGNQQLHAFVLATEPAEELPGALRAFAARSLPDYMVPTGIELVDAFPITANGKIDRSRLSPTSGPARAEHRAPRTDTETALCAIFGGVLDQESVGIDDNFFDLGGHSMLATRTVSRVRRDLGVQLGIRDLFEAPTVAQLAERVSAEQRADDRAVLIPLRATGSRTPLFCVHPAVGLGWVYAPLIGRLDAEQPIFALQSPGLADHAGLPDSVPAMAARYVQAIRHQQPSGPYQLLGWSYGAGVAHEMAAQLEDQGEQVSLLAMLDGYPPNPEPYPVLQPGDRQNLLLLLGSLGHRLAPDQPLDYLEYLRLSRTEDSPLAGFDDRLVAALPAVFARNLSVLNEFQPRKIAADVLYFDAVADKDDRSPVPTDWLPYLSGNLEVVPLQCTHTEVLQPGPLADILGLLGPLLDPRQHRTRSLPQPSEPYRRRTSPESEKSS